MKILIDSGCGATLINKNLIGKLKTTKEKKTKWKTKAGNFATERKCKINFTLPALFEKGKLTGTAMWMKAVQIVVYMI